MKLEWGRIRYIVIYSITSIPLLFSAVCSNRFVYQNNLRRFPNGIWPDTLTHIRASSGFLPRISARIPTALCNRVQKPEADNMNLQNKIHVQNSLALCI